MTTTIIAEKIMLALKRAVCKKVWWEPTEGV